MELCDLVGGEGGSYIREALNCAKLDCARARRPRVRGRYIVGSVMANC